MDDTQIKLCSEIVYQELSKPHIIELYQAVDNCFTKEYFSEKGLKKGTYQRIPCSFKDASHHMTEIMELLFSQNKIKLICSLDSEDDVGETTFNTDIYLIQMLFEDLNHEDDNISKETHTRVKINTTPRDGAGKAHSL
jgi:hypothetical protein